MQLDSNINTPGQTPPQEPKLQPTDPAIPATPVSKSLQAPLRTFEGDVAQALQKKKASVVQIAVAESKKKTNTETIGAAAKTSFKAIATLILALVFLGGGAGVIFYLYTQGFFDPTTVPITTTVVPSLVEADFQHEINMTEQRNVIETITNIRQNSNASVGSISHIYFTQNIGETKEMLNTATFFTIINSHAPDALVRSLKNEFMFGFHESLTNEPFLILKTDSFQNTFAGMLEWEKVMLEDVDELFTQLSTRTVPVDVAPAESTAPVATSTASTTALVESFIPERSTKDVLAPKGFFEDSVIRNKDVRVLRNTNNKTLLLYTFIDPQTVVLATSDLTLREILNRIEKRVYER